MNRRQFVITLGNAFPVIAGASYLIGCSGGLLEPDIPDLDIRFLTVTATTEAGHTHSMVVPADEISSPSDITHTSSPGADSHRHMVTLTVAHFATLRGGGSVTVTSTTDAGHSHDFSFRQ